MKRFGSKKRQAEPISQQEEETLWQQGLLGDKDPQVLLDTMVFCNGLYFALRSGREHRQLRLRPCQIQLIEGERPYLQYTEDISKNRPGGIKGRNVKPKIVLHHANTENPERCFVRLFKKYIELCPTTPSEMDAFYLQPAAKPTETRWYTSKPLGHNKLTKTMARLCEAAGIEGFKTNHSLRATTATRLYQSGVDEQLVMERTGHRSIDGVRNYKRTSAEQREPLSDILNNKAKVPKISKSDESDLPQNSSELVPIPSPSEQPSTQLVPIEKSAGVLSHDQKVEQHESTQLASTSNTNVQLNTKYSLPGNFVFNSSTITFNISY